MALQKYSSLLEALATQGGWATSKIEILKAHCTKENLVDEKGLIDNKAACKAVKAINEIGDQVVADTS